LLTRLADFAEVWNELTGVTMDWKEMIAKIWHDQTGATAVEYGLILAMIFLAMITALEGFGASFDQLWTQTTQVLATAISA
jgi:pilus assembly protein Flp/PilA